MNFNRRQLNLWGIPQVEETIVPAIPYMGSKRKLANKILNAIYQTIGDFDTLYDLFGGGGAMSIAALKAGHEVFYNEFNPAIADLMRHVFSGGEIPKTWVSRERFFELIAGTDWRAGIAQCCWSFGNNQKGYLFGPDVELLKKLGHEIVVDKSIAARVELEKILKINLPDLKSRNAFSAFFKRINNRLDLQQLENLEQLERLQQLENLERLKINNGSYSDVNIKSDAVIYCDPPYADTAKYNDGGFDSVAFWQWCRDNKNPVFISEYKAPKDFLVIAEFEHKSTLSSTNNAKITVEKLFWNGVKNK